MGASVIPDGVVWNSWWWFGFSWGCKRSFRECIELFILGYEHTARENRYTLATLYGVLSNDGHALQELRHSCIWVLSRCSEGARIFPVCEIFFRGWEYNVFYCLEQNRTILSSFTRGSSLFLLPSITSRDAFPTSNPVSSSWYIFLGCQTSLIFAVKLLAHIYTQSRVCLWSLVNQIQCYCEPLGNHVS